MSQGSHPILQVVKLRPRGVLDPALQRAHDAAPWVCRALGSVFQWQQDCSLLGRGGFEWGLLLCQGVHTLCRPTSRGSQGAFPCPEKRDLQRLGVSHLCSSPRALLARCSLPALSPGDGDSCRTGCLLVQSVGSTRALSVGQLQVRAPCHPYQQGGSRPGAKGSQPHPCRAGARAGGIATAPR